MSKKLFVIFVRLAILLFIAVIFLTNDNVKEKVNTKILIPLCVIGQFLLLSIGLFIKNRK